MPDILIRGVRMPVACSDCPSRDVSVCVWTDDYNVESYKFSRPSFCPLHKLPEHGDLIDRDEYIAMLESNCDKSTTLDSYILHVCSGGVKTMPVIVPSNKEDAE